MNGTKGFPVCGSVFITANVWIQQCIDPNVSKCSDPKRDCRRSDETVCVDHSEHLGQSLNRASAFGSPRSILRIKPRMYADGLLPEATTTTPIAT